MRPLKRPMFKYGGDVKKQGIMHGMNGLRDGGVATTMADATGYAGGGMTMPDMRGRVTGPGGYAGKVPGMLPINETPRTRLNIGVPEQSTKITKTAGKIGNFYDKGRTFVKSPAFSEKGIMDAAKKYGPKAFNVGKGIVGTGIKRFPAISFGLAAEYLTRPTEYDKVLAEQKGYGPYESRLRKQLDFNYQRKMINLMEEQPELFDTARGITPKKKTGEGGPGNVPDAVINPPKTQAQIDAEIKALEDQKLNKIYSLLGVDRAKRGAAGKALADISRYIDEGGKDTVSRKNIASTLTKGILAFDKRLDKVDQLKEAAGLMMAKGEIEKDIYKEKGNASTQQLNALSKASGRSLEYVANAKLGIANSPAEAKAQLAKLKNVALTSDSVTAVIQQYADENGIKFQKQYTTDQKNDKVGKGKEYATVVDLVEDLKLDPKGSNDGLYVIGTSIVQVDKGIAKLKG